jgi:hypothetical protein
LSNCQRHDAGVQKGRSGLCNASTPSGTISNILRTLNPIGPNAITISGTCRDNLIIDGFDRLSLIAKPGAAIIDGSGGQ